MHFSLSNPWCAQSIQLGACFRSAGGQLLGQATPAAVDQATSMFKLLGTQAGTLASNVQQQAKAVTDSGFLALAALVLCMPPPRAWVLAWA